MIVLFTLVGFKVGVDFTDGHTFFFFFFFFRCVSSVFPGVLLTFHFAITCTGFEQ